MPDPSSMPAVKMGRIGFAEDGSVWDLMTSKKVGDISGEITMGPAIRVNAGDVLNKGYWVLSPAGIIDPDCLLIVSDGTTTSPDNGKIYLLTVS